MRENLGLPDGFFRNDREHQLPLITAIRRYQPEVVLANVINDRHPDHGRAAQLATDACFLAGLRMIETFGDDGLPQAAWRPKNVYTTLRTGSCHGAAGGRARSGRFAVR